jgi:gas vesicle protein
MKKVMGKRREKMDNNSSTNSGQTGKFFNGFLLGCLVGTAVVFLLGTKKGKKLLKAISEEGIDNISDILERADKTLEADEFPDDEEGESSFTESAGKEVNQVKEEIVKSVRPKVKRFFRGISKKVN